MTAVLEKKGAASKRIRAAKEHRAAERIRVEQSIRRHISNYFSDASIPPDVDIFSRRYLDLCLESDTCGAVDAAYRAMGAMGVFQESCGDGTMGKDVQIVIGILKEIRQKCVPQEFSPGILLMHLEILEGLKF